VDGRGQLVVDPGLQVFLDEGTGIGSAAVLDQAKATKINEIIDRHWDISDPQFQEVLDLLEADLEAVVGKTKNDHLAYLKQSD